MRPYIRCATLHGYAELARSLGLNPAQQMARVGLDLADLAVPNKWIPAAPAAWLLELSAADSGCEDFGLRLSERRRLATLGPLSVVLREEPDLSSALHLLIRHERSYNDAVHLQLTEANGLATLEIQPHLSEPTPTRQGLELVVGAIVGIMRELMPTDWYPRAVRFSHRAPERLATHQRLLGPRLQFGCEFTGLLLPIEELAQPNVLVDPLLTPYRPQLLQAVPPPRALTLAEKVRELVETLLPVGRHSMPQVARSLGLTTRTLRRRLDDEQETYSSIVDEARTALAQRYLANGRYSLTDVAYQLGFGAPSGFSRWFRDRFGMSPTDWRRLADGANTGTRTVESGLAATR
jgi:AraC-like DNA-binding protein